MRTIQPGPSSHAAFFQLNPSLWTRRRAWCCRQSGQLQIALVRLSRPGLDAGAGPAACHESVSGAAGNTRAAAS